MVKKLINGLLLLSIIGLLLAYFLTVNDLPQRIYTPEQQEYLNYNNSRNIIQNAPTMNFLSSGLMAGTVDVLRIMPDSESHVRADLKARYEEQQGITVTLYDLEFQGGYVLIGPASGAVEVELVFPFPDNLETLHDVRFAVNGDEVPNATYTTRAISWRTTLISGDEHRIDISYKASGVNNFTYGLPREQRSAIDAVITITGLSGSRVPRASLQASKITPTSNGETFTWNYTGLIANRDIQISLPTRLSFAQRIAELQDDFRLLARLAPFLVGLFVACLAGLFSLNSLRVPLEEYLLAGLGMAFFYPMLTVISGLIGVLPAILLSLGVVSGLLFGFIGFVAGWAKTWRPLGILLLVFPGLFSLGILTPWRGLLLTSGGLLLLTALMWAYVRRPTKTITQEPVNTPDPGPPQPDIHSFCTHCGYALEDSYAFCPTCGHDTRTVVRCESCGNHQYVPTEEASIYCVSCGTQLS